MGIAFVSNNNMKPPTYVSTLQIPKYATILHTILQWFSLGNIAMLWFAVYFVSMGIHNSILYRVFTREGVSI